AGLFGVKAETTVTGTLAMFAALFTPSTPNKGTLAKRWDRMADRLATIGATTTLVSIPFLIYAVLAHPSFDGIVNIHPVVLGLVLATFTGFGGEALLHLAGKVTKWSPPARLVKFFSAYSAATIAAYGMIYQLRHLPLLISVTGALTLGGLAHWVLTRPHLSPRAKVGHTLAGAALTGVNALAAAALFLGWPALPTAVAITTGVVGVLATLAWAWSIRGPPSGPSGPTTPDTGTPRPTGPSSTSPTTGGAAPPTEKPGGEAAGESSGRPIEEPIGRGSLRRRLGAAFGWVGGRGKDREPTDAEKAYRAALDRSSVAQAELARVAAWVPWLVEWVGKDRTRSDLL